jgi:hypothetical protein
VLASAIALAGCAAPSDKGKTTPEHGTPWSSTQPTASGVPKPNAPPRGPSAKLTINDPCPARLHDICGPLLLYYATNYHLPARVEELQRIPGFESVGPYVCPVSKQPYVYDAKGIVGPNIVQRAVIYDAAPSHGGYRWAIVVEEANGNDPLIAKVVAWPESRFAKPAAAPK